MTFASSSAVSPRNGPPLAVRTRLSGSPWSAHWKIAECSLSTGIRSPLPRALACSARSPAATRLSLFARASVTPFSSAHIVGIRPAKPTTAFSTMSGSSALEQLRRVSPGLSQRCQPVDRLRPRRRGDELEIRMRVDHLDRLAPDRAGRAKQGDPLHSLSVAPGSTLDSPALPISGSRRRRCRSTRRGRRRAAHPGDRACRRGRRGASLRPSRPHRA